MLRVLPAESRAEDFAQVAPESMAWRAVFPAPGIMAEKALAFADEILSFPPLQTSVGT